MRVLLMGGTDLTMAVGVRLREIGVEVAGVVYVPRVFGISYQPSQLLNTRFSDLARWCSDVGIPGVKYDGPESVVAHASACSADFALVAGWYHTVPRSVRDRFPKGCAGLHASLLPKFRGGAPLPWAILAGETEAGISLFELGDGMDDGPLFGQRAFPIGPRTTVGDLVNAAEGAALDLVTQCVPEISAGRLTPSAQHGVQSYSLQRSPEDGRIDWSRSATEIDRLVRAVGRPYPGAFTTLDGKRLFIWAAEPLTTVQIYGTPGQIARIPGEPNVCVVSGTGALALREVTDEQGESCLPLLRQSGNRRLTS